MGAIARIVLEAMRESGRPDAPRRNSVIEIDVSQYGDAKVRLRLGDMDGSGSAPGVQLEIEHPYVAGRVASVALSAEEAELVGKAAIVQAGKLRPHERLRARVVKWRESFE